MQGKIDIEPVRVRFAPAPTGMMHLGNIRAALFNFLFARQHNGVFVLRIEDTDVERNYDPGAKQIMSDLSWLGLDFDEGPNKGGPYGPYFQSERTAIYKKALGNLIEKNAVYRCFCTIEELEKKRQRQVALKLPPRYDKACLKLTAEQIDQFIKNAKPFIWRLNITPDIQVSFTDLAKGLMIFETNNLTDFPLTRQNGSFTFLFANCVDDIQMKITHVFRGEDHLTNSANQLLLYKAFEAPIPVFFHLPIICNVEGKKLSKRDFGFSIKDLQDGGYLPQAVCNYLAILGASFEQEIMSLEELITCYDFGHLPSTSQIRYDVSKLNWMNHKWIAKLPLKDLTQACLPFLQQAYPSVIFDQETLLKLIELVKTDLITLKDIVPLARFFFEHPVISQIRLAELEGYNTHKKTLYSLIKKHETLLAKPTEWINALKKNSKEQEIPLKLLFHVIRLALLDNPEGPNIQGVLEILDLPSRKKRIDWLLRLME